MINIPTARSTTPDAFAGAWLVSEYVYSPDGAFVGMVHQRRRLEQQADGSIHVTQVCDPSPELANHPMADFRGEWVFRLTRDGNRRLYHGPDVIGSATLWANNAMTARGVWTRFGHNFTSFSIRVAEDRHITGGKFYNAGEIVACILGVTAPEMDGTYPELSQNAPTRHWIAADHEREYTDAGWIMMYADRMEPIPVVPDGTRLRVGKYGIGKRYGCLLEYTTVIGSGYELAEVFEVTDETSGTLVQFWQQAGKTDVTVYQAGI
jgi:hypothetical protein